MRILLLAGCLLACYGPGVAQDFNTYKTLLPKGPIPRDFTEQSSVKVATEITSISEKKSRLRKSKKDFVLESTFSVDDFLASGAVLFNDDISLYLDQVLKELTKSYPDLQKKLRVYAVKSAGINAFTTNDGLIFVNLGLLSRLENEAQLAFVLSHEIVHYQKKHVINAYVTNIEIDRSKGDYRKLSVSEKGFAKSSYAKELESEADLLGSDIYSKSTYSLDSVENVFNILRMADFPISWTSFNPERFESGSYVFPDTLTLRKLKLLTIREDYDDSKSSHPSTKKRREAIRQNFKSKTGGNYYVISERQFTTAKKLAQYELCRLHLLEHRYTEALTLALNLQESNSQSTYLRETIAKALYGIAKLSLNKEFELNRERWVGEPERVAHFIQGQSSYELSVLALRELYRNKELTPNNTEINLMVSDLMESFITEYPGAAANFLRAASDKEPAKLKYPYTQYAFLDFRDSKAFFDQFSKVTPKKKAAVKKSTQKKKVKRQSLNINKVVVVNPMYKKIDTRKKQKLRHVETEEVLLNINDKILAAAEKLDMNTDIINTNKIGANDVVIMQENSIMNDWLDEQMRSGAINMISPIYNEVITLATAHKTDHFAWMGGITMRHKISGKGFAILGAIIVPAAAPLSIFYLVRPQGKTLYFALVFDVRKQELEMVDLRVMGIRDSEQLLQSNIYYSLFMLKK